MSNRKYKCTPCCDDQLPSISVVGRGPKGNSSYIEIGEPDSCTETYLHGYMVDETTGEVVIDSEWQSENINGGELKYQYNLRPYSNPRVFTITFIYRRPGRHEWSWTTPAIPYIWSVDNGDGTVSEKPDHIVGTGVATLFVKTMHDTKWNERLHYPIDPDNEKPYPREYFNAPDAEGEWSSTITFGFGGDIDVPDLDDLAKVIGISREEINNWLSSKDIILNEIDARNVVDYIDKCDKRDLDHIHADLGFCDSDHDASGSFGGKDTVKEYIDDLIDTLDTKITNLTNIVVNMKDGIGSLIYGATVDDDGTIHIPAGTKIPTGNINIFSGGDSKYIRTMPGENVGDLKGM